MTNRPTFKITNGCPKTGHMIACNVTQDAPAFSDNVPSAADRANEGMATHRAYKANEAAFRAAKEAAKGQSKPQPKRFLSDAEVSG